MDESSRALPRAPGRAAWSALAPGAGGGDGALCFRGAEGAPRSAALRSALPLLFHDFDAQPGLTRMLEATRSELLGGSPRSVLRRLLPRLCSYRADPEGSWRYLFDGLRPEALHVLGRVLETDFRFWLEDLSHFATHGDFLVRCLEVSGVEGGLNADATLYAPALDPFYPFKFFVVGSSEEPARARYLSLLRELWDRSESDERFRERGFRELARGFAKFGPAAATPSFQAVELKIWRLLSYLAARLRVKVGQLTDGSNPAQVQRLLGELRRVHEVVDGLAQLPAQLAAYYRRRYALGFGDLASEASARLEALAARVDCELDGGAGGLDEVARLVAHFRGLGQSAPIESSRERERSLRRAYGEGDLPETLGFEGPSFGEAIFTDAERYDARRFQAQDGAAELGAELSEREFEEGLEELLDSGSD